MNLTKFLTLPAGLLTIFGIGYPLRNSFILFLIMGIYILIWLLLYKKDFINTMAGEE